MSNTVLEHALESFLGIEIGAAYGLIAYGTVSMLKALHEIYLDMEYTQRHSRLGK